MALKQKEKEKNESSYTIIWFSPYIHWKAGIHIKDWYSILSFFYILFLGLRATHL
jgi:hypothetical protein